MNYVSHQLPKSFYRDLDLEKGSKIVVAMSGGVDSSVVAALLSDLGYQVIGITLQLYDHGQMIEKKGACCAGQDIYDAKRVAQHIGFSHYTFDYETRFSNQVIEEFADSYLLGETPIPCVKCNQTVKFVDLLEITKSLGADAMATGHYVQRKNPGSDKKPYLCRGYDPNRDQSYFLFGTSIKQIDFLRFPIGGMQKSAVRELARYYGLKISEKPDSQDICFVPNGKYTDLIQKLRPNSIKSGEIIHIDGRVLGKHQGIIHYTIGQRRNLGIAIGEPLYVIRINAEHQQVIVGPKPALLKSWVPLKEVNWIGEGDFGQHLEGQEVWVKLRSSNIPQKAKFAVSKTGKIAVSLEEPMESITPGQACVFYDSSNKEARLFGGGWIGKEIEDIY